MECAKSSCLTMTSLGLRAACPSHLTLCRLIWSAMLAWPVRASSSAVEGPSGPFIIKLKLQCVPRNYPYL